MSQRTLKLAIWILSRLAHDSEREPLVGDLIEEHALRVSAAAAPAAHRWCLQQVWASAPPLLWARVTRAACISTFGVALLAYIAVGVVEFLVNWTLFRSSASGAGGYNPLGLLIEFPLVVLIGYFAALLRRRAAIALGAMMLIAVTVMTLTTAESMPHWYRIAYFVAGPSAALIGTALCRLRTSNHIRS
jgi:uncharacterized membrane protein AbrB (regulator of aidB expression)